MYRKFVVAFMVVAMLAAVAAPAFAEPPEPGGDMGTGEPITEGLLEAMGEMSQPAVTGELNGAGAQAIRYYGWLNLTRGYRWSLIGNTYVISQAYNASSRAIYRMIVKNRLCKRRSCTVWTKNSGYGLVWIWAGWSRTGGFSIWTNYGRHTWINFGVKRTGKTSWRTPL